MSTDKPPAKRKKPETPADRVLAVKLPDHGDKALGLAQVSQSPIIHAAALSNSLNASLIGSTPISDTVRALQSFADEIKSGDMGRAEEALVGQAYTLDSLFMELVRLWRRNVFENFQVSDMLLRQALKAQSQARSTWET